MPLTEADIARIVREFEERGQQGRALLAGGWDEIEARVRAEGLPEDLITYMRARRDARTELHKLARGLFPVEPMPLPSVLTFNGEPDAKE